MAYSKKSKGKGKSMAINQHKRMAMGYGRVEDTARDIYGIPDKKPSKKSSSKKKA